MTTYDGEVLAPFELILPLSITEKPLSGQIFLSGAAICFYNGTTHRILVGD